MWLLRVYGIRFSQIYSKRSLQEDHHISLQQTLHGLIHKDGRVNWLPTHFALACDPPHCLVLLSCFSNWRVQFLFDWMQSVKTAVSDVSSTTGQLSAGGGGGDGVAGAAVSAAVVDVAQKPTRCVDVDEKFSNDWNLRVLATLR
jgi:hypothetical protein